MKLNSALARVSILAGKCDSCRHSILRERRSDGKKLSVVKKFCHFALGRGFNLLHQN